ncbi:UNVERIFIED_CONTAM: hypothetical protein Slati_2680500 [Sesamum latifolium]|uniref:MULE transposase domain-containing protein n=1 Tax=Sesamum latifolium TaxID=2727402 RepID=A0AAW2VVV9_9LAMI
MDMQRVFRTKMKEIHLWVKVMEHFGAEVAAQNEIEDEGVTVRRTVKEDKIGEGHIFSSVDAFRPALREYAIREGFKVQRHGHELQKFGVSPPYMQLYRAKKIAMLGIEGNHAASFGMLTKYVEIVNRTNPESILKLQYAHELKDIPPTPTFKRAFMCLKALRDGFLEGCNSFIGFDGCHLKGPYGGVLLAAVKLDENNDLYLLAFAVVEVECKDSWGFFFQCLENML